MIHPETRAITIHVSEKVFAGLVETGRKRGYTPSLFAKLLFEAGYASSVGKGAGDPILAECVEKSLARRAPAAAQAKTVGAAEPIRYVVVPVLVPVPIAVTVRSEPLVAHISAGHPAEMSMGEHLGALKRSTAVHLGALIGAAAAKVSGEVEQPMPCDRPPGWSLSQWTFARLVCRDEGASIGEVMEALAPAYQDRSSISVLISKMRPKLRSVGIEIETVDVWGWRVERHTRAAADALLGRAA